MKQVIKVKYLGVENEFGDELFELNDGQRLFDFIGNNTEIDEKIELQLVEITDEEWKQACKRGEEMA